MSSKSKGQSVVMVEKTYESGVSVSDNYIAEILKLPLEEYTVKAIEMLVALNVCASVKVYESMHPTEKYIPLKILLEDLHESDPDGFGTWEEMELIETLKSMGLKEKDYEIVKWKDRDVKAVDIYNVCSVLQAKVPMTIRVSKTEEELPDLPIV